MPIPTPVLILEHFYEPAPGAQQEKLTTYWLPGTHPTTGADMTSVANAAHTNIGNAIAACITDEGVSVGTRAKFLDGGTFLEGWSTSASIPGEIGGGAMPLEVCAIIRKSTSQGGREHRGRWFLGCLGEDTNTDGRIDIADSAPFRALATILGADVNLAAAGMSHARHWDRKHNTLDVITLCTAMAALLTRNDRIKKLRRINSPAL
jgi:hypothetical protein